MSEIWQKIRKFFQNKVNCIAVVCTIAILCITFAFVVAHNIAEERRIDAEALTLNDDLTVEFGEDIRVSDFVAELKGEIVTNPEVDTTKLGEQEVSLEFYNIKHKKRVRNFVVEVVDTTEPEIYGRDYYTVELGYDEDLTDLVMSGDGVDDNPKREVVGEYDLGKVGNYQVEYVITDASGNMKQHPFVLQVVEPSRGNAQQSSSAKATPIAEIIKEHKKDDTKIGIDVSSWQGDIDWQKVKNSGVEFAMIRVGYQVEFGGDYILDKKFVNNIKGANEVRLPVGVYFYSCANSVEEAKKQAEWMVEQIKDYDVQLGVSFDWEEWKNFNKAGMSFYTLNRVARTFIEAVNEAGYAGILYGSKNYIERFWRGDYKLWLAQYYDRVTYDGEYYIWQMMDTGSVPGISGYVDLDVMYLE